jgi:hypothetical protein
VDPAATKEKPTNTRKLEENGNKTFVVYLYKEKGFAEAQDSKAKAIYATLAKEPIVTIWLSKVIRNNELSFGNVAYA